MKATVATAITVFLFDYNIRSIQIDFDLVRFLNQACSAIRHFGFRLAPTFPERGVKAQASDLDALAAFDPQRRVELHRPA